MPSVFSNLIAVTDTITGASFACTAKEIRAPIARRIAYLETLDGSGAIDTRGAAADPLAARTLDATLVHVYAPGETLAAAWAAFVLAAGQGNPLRLTERWGDDSLHYYFGRAETIDKRVLLDYVGYCEIPLTVQMADPTSQWQFRPGLRRLDSGNFLDSGAFLDSDPDLVPIITAVNNHTVTNPGSVADEAPIVTLYGPLGAPISVINQGIVLPSGLPLYFVYNAAVADGETVIVDCEQLDVASSNPAVDAYANLVIPTGQDEWFRINPGAQNLQIQVTGSLNSHSKAQFSWTPRDL